MRYTYIPLRLSLVLALMITKHQQSSAKPIDCKDVCKQMEAMLGMKRYSCIKLCDSVNESSKRASFMRIGRASFMRIGRAGTSDDSSVDNENLERETRPYLYNIKRPSFMRIGKKSDDGMDKRASFMRIGKSMENAQKKASFMRIGKKASFMRIGKKDEADTPDHVVEGDKKAEFEDNWSRR